jgi:hypothetical protein
MEYDFSKEGQKSFYEKLEDVKMGVALSNMKLSKKKKYFESFHLIEQNYNRKKIEYLNNKISDIRKPESSLIIKIRYMEN